MADGAKAVSIRWNGKEITDLAELPPDVQKVIAYDANGVAYLAHLEKISSVGSLEIESTTRSQAIDSDEPDEEIDDDGGKPVSIRWNGKEITDLAELPLDVRKAIAYDANGVPYVTRGQRFSSPGRLEIDSTTASSDLSKLPPEVRDIIEHQVMPLLAGAPATVVTRERTVHSARVELGVVGEVSAGGDTDLPRAAPARPPRQPALSPAARSSAEPVRPRPVGPPWGIVVGIAILGAALLLYLLLRRGR